MQTKLVIIYKKNNFNATITNTLQNEKNLTEQNTDDE